MGCTQSKSDDVASQEAAEGVSPADVAAVVVEKAMDLAEEVELSEVDFSLASLPIVNPSLQSFSASSSIAWLKEVVDGTKFEISMTAPIEFVVRCMCNTAMKRMKGTDLGDWVSKLVKADMTKLQDSISKLQTAALLTASDQLRQLLQAVPDILEIEDEAMRKSELAIFKDSAEDCKKLAQLAWNKVETPEEQIRAVQVSVGVLVATAFCRSPKVLRTNISAELAKLLSLPRVLSDARHQLHPDASEKALDFKAAREERIRAVISVILHAESFAATNGLPPIVPAQASRGSFLGIDLGKRKSLGAASYPVKALLQSGLYEGKRTVKDFMDLGNPFSDKELCVVAGFLEEDAEGAFGEEAAAGKAAQEEAARKAQEEAAEAKRVADEKRRQAEADAAKTRRDEEEAAARKAQEEAAEAKRVADEKRRQAEADAAAEKGGGAGGGKKLQEMGGSDALVNAAVRGNAKK
ncbi:hypothetical protein TeGR_g8516, partial [Tetraparma gracilis]